MPILQNVNKFLKLDYPDNDNIWLSSGITLRKLVGIVGMLLPALLWFFYLLPQVISVLYIQSATITLQGYAAFLS